MRACCVFGSHARHSTCAYALCVCVCACVCVCVLACVCVCVCVCERERDAIICSVPKDNPTPAHSNCDVPFACTQGTCCDLFPAWWSGNTRIRSFKVAGIQTIWPLSQPVLTAVLSAGLCLPSVTSDYVTSDHGWR